MLLDQAACIGADMFPDPNRAKDVEIAVSICESCPVKVICAFECANQADGHSEFGVWHGILHDRIPAHAEGPKCSEERCERKVEARLLCGAHYQARRLKAISEGTWAT